MDDYDREALMAAADWLDATIARRLLSKPTVAARVEYLQELVGMRQARRTFDRMVKIEPRLRENNNVA